MSISKVEQETIILFNEAEKIASVYTYNGKLKRKLGDMAEKFPDQVKLTKEEPYGGVTYEIPKTLISIRQPTSDKVKQAARERAIKSNFGQKS